MTEQRKQLIKVICAVVLILAFPILFFKYIGDNPMKVKENATRTIAVVNEDLGVENEENTLNFGDEIPALLNEDSNYKWTVLSRSAAENGLKNIKYDAIIYIPSKFTENILTYEEVAPKKATLQYVVQDQLNAVNKEKVIGELEEASNKVNKNMSSLYWSYISQEVKNVRDQFDKILEKEKAFQNAMFSFYSPNSKKLSDEIKNQKQLLESIQSSMKLAEEGSLKQNTDVEEVAQSLENFVQYVEAYKLYQQNQKDMLKKVQGESSKIIENGLISMETFMDKTYNQQLKPISENLTGIQGKIEDSYQFLSDLNEARMDRVDHQRKALSTFHSELLDRYQQQYERDELNGLEQVMLPLRKELINGYHNENSEGASETSEPEQPDDGENLSPTTMKEQQEEKTVHNQQIYQTAEVNIIISKIKQLENTILASEQLSEERKKKLQLVFNGGVTNLDTDKLLHYYSYLSRYSSIIHKMGSTENASKKSVLADKELNENVKNILMIQEEEQQAWNKLKTGLEGTEGDMKEFQIAVNQFLEEYTSYVEEEQGSVVKELDAIQVNLGKMSELIETPFENKNEGTSTGQSINGRMLLSLQKSLGHELQGMNQLMGSLGDRQTNIVVYTNRLQQKVNGVQEKADNLNQKWAKNVTSTQMIQKDVYNLLGNTFIDGQNNGYIYDYLSNPLEISGEVPKEKNKTVPPVVILVIILISSLLIGYLSHYFRGAPLLVKGALFSLLNLIVGLMISLFGLTIYSLADDRAIQWTIFTILLLVASSTLVRVSFYFGSLIGWFVSVGVMIFFITPLLDLTIPNFNYEDPISKVYMSIQYELSTLFGPAVLILGGLIVILTMIPIIGHTLLSNTQEESKNVHEG
ncbi:type VII secretion EsaA-like protein [Oikeobacillus pervagus]|uniref:Type VII secretion EsaA-like protein n=1 Tax=Oikeobacillus pervagus TaxID=1325931 RepID=A0AAJ1WL54_9BACI|nr:type VII secretion protein EsaA [Oikeobacillus pervagus]MDQ0215836.1 type VII secretion EsaA-like protein [Oikeobacillus pervagus]